MDITEVQLNWLFGCLLIFGLVVAYPSLITAIALLRSERKLRKLFWQFVVAIDIRRKDRNE